jgi:hypothetical protein
VWTEPKRMWTRKKGDETELTPFQGILSPLSISTQVAPS